mmetsp:Transcript_87440/g.199800  ORF Transcript_87440/g.199800 Transcript_87440/m.199800 type:complete len:260 (-) Transcript_87440:2369-3148(-)
MALPNFAASGSHRNEASHPLKPALLQVRASFPQPDGDRSAPYAASWPHQCPIRPSASWAPGPEQELEQDQPHQNGTEILPLPVLAATQLVGSHPAEQEKVQEQQQGPGHLPRPQARPHRLVSTTSRLPQPAHPHRPAPNHPPQARGPPQKELRLKYWNQDQGGDQRAHPKWQLADEDHHEPKLRPPSRLQPPQATDWTEMRVRSARRQLSVPTQSTIGANVLERPKQLSMTQWKRHNSRHLRNQFACKKTHSQCSHRPP